MSEYLSQKIKILSLISIIAVVFWHGAMIPNPTSSFKAFYLMQNLITASLFRFSVPTFFAISGYLFFLKPFNYIRQINKRFRSLFIPYMIWSFTGAIFMYSLLSAPSIKSHIHLDWEYTTLAFIRHATIDPIQYQFWFLRDLMLLTLLSPLIWWGAKNVALPVTLLLGGLWFVLGDYTYLLRIDSLLFFTIGATLAIKKSKLIETTLSRNTTFFLGIIWMTSSIIQGLHISSWHPIAGWFGVYQLSILLGVVFVWSGYDHLYQTRLIKWIKQSHITETSFFIFCLHEPLLTIFEKIGMQWADSNGKMMFLYFTNPSLVLIICILTFKVLKNIQPRMITLLLGGR